MRRALVAVLVLTLAGVACGRSSVDDASVVTPVPELSEEPGSTARVEAATPSPVPLRNGRHFGYVDSVDVAGRTIDFDEAEFLTGAEADKAAAEDGAIEPGQHVDNDYYVRNELQVARTYKLASSVEVEIVNWKSCCDTIAGDLRAFANAFPPGKPTDTYHGVRSPYWIATTDGKVTAVEEQYLP